ncbi:MAG: hypothetical protein LIP16_15285 [Clostridium sp.]|nr:hypothetical protein [Clostridium sp.]
MPVFEDIPKSMLFGIVSLLIYDLGGQRNNKFFRGVGKTGVLGSVYFRWRESLPLDG